MKRFLFLLLTLALPASALDVKIEGPTHAAPGDLIILTAKADGAKHYSWKLANSDKSFLPVEEGKKAVFSSGLLPGQKSATYIFVMAASNESELGQGIHKIVIGEKPGPEPEPNPDPDDDDTDPVDPAPLPEPGFRVLIVYETAEMTKYPLETQVILAGADVREFLKTNCVSENGQPGFRIYDADINLGGDLEVWKKAMTRPRTELPWVVISNGKTGYEGPLPKTPTAFLDLCKKYLPK